MLTRRNSSDSAIGWISTVDSLLLGFGLMLVLALHSAMTRQRLQVDANRTAAQLAEEKKAVEDLQGKDKARQEAIEALESKRKETEAQLKKCRADVKAADQQPVSYTHLTLPTKA